MCFHFEAPQRTLPLSRVFPVEFVLVRLVSHPASCLTCLRLRACQPVIWEDEGMVKRVRGVAFTSRVAPQTAARMVDAARGLLNRLLPDVFIFTDHYSGIDSGRYARRML